MIDAVRKHAQEWKPKFTVVNSAYVCADMINQPHEDYPLRVNVTGRMIEMVLYSMRGSSVVREITGEYARQIHSGLFAGKGMNQNRIKRGNWRQVNVWVSNYRAPDHIHVPQLIEEVFPVRMNDNLQEWYALFQSVHPFEDGNGRVGGIIVAALSYLRDGRFLAPLQ